MAADSRFKNNPFAALRGAKAPPRQPEPTAADTRQALGRVVVREEFDSETSAVISRMIGLPAGQPGALGKRMHEALGVEVVIEGRDLLVMDGDCERVASWIRSAGASEVVVVRRPPDLSQAGKPGGTVRAEIRRGLRVAIVMKADQESGALTQGVVRDILTSAAVHPRGIKVRLETGEVGRVRRILTQGE